MYRPPLIILLVLRVSSFKFHGRQFDTLRSRPPPPLDEVHQPHRRDGVRRGRGGRLQPLAQSEPFTADEMISFQDWMERKREPDSGTVVLDAGIEVTTALELSGVAWRILADVSTNQFGTEGQVIVSFTGLAYLGKEPLSMFCDIFDSVKNDPELKGALVELQRLSVLLPDIPGPALVINARARTVVEEELARERRTYAIGAEEGRTTVALQSFVGRVVVAGKSCPYTSSTDTAATGLEAQGVEKGPVAYRFSGCCDVLDAISQCWMAFAEVLNTPETDLSTTLLSLPAAAHPEQGPERFMAFCEFLTKSFLIYGTDQLLGLVFFHPLYDRDQIRPRDDAAYGHIPPLHWLPAMLAQTGAPKADQQWLAADAEARSSSNYQRRAPCLMVNILRADQLSAATGGLSVTTITVPAVSPLEPGAAPCVTTEVEAHIVVMPLPWQSGIRKSCFSIWLTTWPFASRSLNGA